MQATLLMCVFLGLPGLLLSLIYPQHAYIGILSILIVSAVCIARRVLKDQAPSSRKRKHHTHSLWHTLRGRLTSILSSMRAIVSAKEGKKETLHPLLLHIQCNFDQLGESAGIIEGLLAPTHLGESRDEEAFELLAMTVSHHAEALHTACGGIFLDSGARLWTSQQSYLSLGGRISEALREEREEEFCMNFARKVVTLLGEPLFHSASFLVL